MSSRNVSISDSEMSRRQDASIVFRASNNSPQLSVNRASSTGRRNTSVKSLCWGFKSQGLAWSLVELACHFVQMGLLVHRQVRSLRKVLSQQTIGVLIGTTLPRALRIAEVNINVGRQREPAMIRKLLAAVPGQGLIELSR